MAKIERIPYHMLCWMSLLLTMIWYEWLEISTQVESASTSGDNVIDTHGCIAVVEMVSGALDIYFSSPHRTFPFTRIIFLLAKHICQLPALSMRAWEKTNTIFCWEWFENANRKKLERPPQPCENIGASQCVPIKRGMSRLIRETRCSAVTRSPVTLHLRWL